MPATVQERLIRLWAGPQGALKAAMAGAGIGLMAMDRDLGRLLQADSDDDRPDLGRLGGSQAGRHLPDSWRRRRHGEGHSR